MKKKVEVNVYWFVFMLIIASGNFGIMIYRILNQPEIHIHLVK